jgi:hypothetical protein
MDGKMIPGLDALVGGALGGLFRFAPEVLKFMDRKGDRAHELAMFDKQLAADAQKSAEQLAAINAQHLADADNKDLDALIAAVNVQGAKTGVGFVDAINALVRPVLTFYWCIGLYTAVLYARWAVLQGQGVAAEAAILQLWGPSEMALVASMMSFWFVDRALRRGGGVGAPH